MKLALCFLVFTATVSAFAPTVFRAQQRNVQLQARPDSSAAVAAALEATQKYGATSPEARVAWDTVEEIDSSDNRYVLNARSSEFYNLITSRAKATADQIEGKLVGRNT